MALILVTGASQGLGLATVQALAGAGHQVVAHARRADRIPPEMPEGVHGILFGDLSDLGQTVDLAAQAEALGRFDAVIHNAGVLDGPEVPMVNVVAPFVLTALMTPPARAILLSSSMHRSASTARTIVTGEGAVTSLVSRMGYSESKLAVTALALAMARRIPQTLAHAVDPGWVPTRMGGPSAPDSLLEGHRTQDWLATAEATDIMPRTGGNWHHFATQRPHPAAQDEAFQEDLLAALEAFTGLTFPG